MTPSVVDTNVATVANGRGSHADLRCQLTCLERLKSVAAGEVVTIDDENSTLAEYKRHLSFSGMPGVGDAFFKHVFDSRFQEDRVRRVAVTPSDDDRRGFEELPENTFHRSDRKFLAVAVVAKAVVLNATDSDWDEHEALMNKLGVKVRQLCPQHGLKRARREQ